MSDLKNAFDKVLDVTLDDIALAETCLSENSLPMGYVNVVDADIRALLDQAALVTAQDPDDLGQAYEDVKAALDLVAELPDDAYLELALSHSDTVTGIGQMPVASYDI
jgi:hypothetical protein